jgi:hypothetical protein
MRLLTAARVSAQPVRRRRLAARTRPATPAIARIAASHSPELPSLDEPSPAVEVGGSVTTGVCVGRGVCAAVGSGLGVLLGTALGAVLGAALGTALGAVLGAVLGALLGTTLGSEVGTGGGGTNVFVMEQLALSPAARARLLPVGLPPVQLQAPAL